jgi:hypothetical protein
MAHPDTRRISFTYPSVASTWVVTLHNLFPYLDLPLPCHPPSYWLRQFPSQNFLYINTPTLPNLVIHTYRLMKMEQTECFETATYKIHTPGNYPEENIQQFPLLLLVAYIPHIQIFSCIFFFKWRRIGRRHFDTTKVTDSPAVED